jgi:hypothetical protein
MKFALYLTTVVSLSVGVMFLLTMIFSSNGGISYLPEHSRIADINSFQEGWIETLLFLLIGMYGLYTLNIRTQEQQKNNKRD